MEQPAPKPPTLNAFKHAALKRDGYLLIDVAPTEPEFTEIIQALGIPHTDHPSYPLIIERVYNPALEAAFDAQVAACRAKRGTDPEILFPMFHGTTEMALNAIMRNGFDPTMNRVSAWGRGTYFARDYLTSAAYSRDDSYGYKIMFACKVIRGISTIGKCDAVLDTRLCDSFTNGLNIIVSPYPAGGIPLYIIRWFHAVPGTVRA
jgi:hypothetical protein